MALPEAGEEGWLSPSYWLGIHKPESQAAVSGLFGWAPGDGKDNRKQELGPFLF